jgi:hypothetical protein
MRNMTKLQWSQLQMAMLSVPLKHRTEVWKMSMEWIESILKDKVAQIPDLEPDSLHYVPKCCLCNGAIALDHDLVFHAASGTFSHYDCHMPSSHILGQVA